MVVKILHVQYIHSAPLMSVALIAKCQTTRPWRSDVLGIVRLNPPWHLYALYCSSCRKNAQSFVNLFVQLNV